MTKPPTWPQKTCRVSGSSNANCCNSCEFVGCSKSFDQKMDPQWISKIQSNYQDAFMIPNWSFSLRFWLHEQFLVPSFAAGHVVQVWVPTLHAAGTFRKDHLFIHFWPEKLMATTLPDLQCQDSFSGLVIRSSFIADGFSALGLSVGLAANILDPPMIAVWAVTAASCFAFPMVFICFYPGLLR